MRTTVRLEDLVGYHEIAERIRERATDPRLQDLHMRTVHIWRQRHDDFPEPVGEWKIGPLFLWPEVEKWALRSGRLER